ncbi:hypothetical protein E1295_05450 [Nonomuraea mesophila]|uniref:Uncharacterized protein n=1 Tax=Nonomuraea mesophila TaxID=2530382 RepID=A0A4V2ZBN4_9ACTN|nr:hypothetical protein E1295_05450 [Nonomuraea mesophila]
MRGILAAGVAAAVVLTSGGAADAAAYPKYETPKIFGTTFQADPKHDFTKGIHSRRNGILRGWITHVRGGTAEYVPIRWKKGKHTQGNFVGPREGHVGAYASPIAKNVVFLSAYGCKATMSNLTVSRKTGLGAKKCPRAALIKRHGTNAHPSLITVYKGRIVKVQEIYIP